MSDLADRAQRHHEKEEELLKLANLKAAPKITGRCHNCGTPVPALFCDIDCRDDFDYRAERGIK